MDAKLRLKKMKWTFPTYTVNSEKVFCVSPGLYSQTSGDRLGDQLRLTCLPLCIKLGVQFVCNQNVLI